MASLRSQDLAQMDLDDADARPTSVQIAPRAWSNSSSEICLPGVLSVQEGRQSNERKLPTGSCPKPPILHPRGECVIGRSPAYGVSPPSPLHGSLIGP
jgi:hypothetical protein